MPTFHQFLKENNFDSEVFDDELEQSEYTNAHNDVYNVIKSYFDKTSKNGKKAMHDLGADLAVRIHLDQDKAPALGAFLLQFGSGNGPAQAFPACGAGNIQFRTVQFLSAPSLGVSRAPRSSQIGGGRPAAHGELFRGIYQGYLHRL